MYFNARCPKCGAYVESIIEYNAGEPFVYVECSCGYDSRYQSTSVSNRSLTGKFVPTVSTTNATETCDTLMSKNRTKNGWIRR